ncbi:DNA replication complex GINS protein SLD5 [Trichinella papuae]|uniref:DNA replication complex GINS protein SLD5 n=1 Tax=Trichinella papuae TaxID=268474 RepID=A0A0V1N8I8_9BILA|nr:DNA replication complex GINS protein SLD5 [Trichinella papuae]
MSNVVEDVEEVELSLPEVIHKLETAWINELNAPVLLRSEAELVDCVKLEMKAVVDQLRNWHDLNSIIKRVEIERMRYLLCSYLRTRLKKIEDQAFHLYAELEANRLSGHISREEHEFLVSYRESVLKHMDVAIYRHIPQNLRAVGDSFKIATRPNLKRFVFVRVLKTMNEVEIASPAETMRMEIVDLRIGTQHLLPFRSILSGLYDGSIQMITVLDLRCVTVEFLGCGIQVRPCAGASPAFATLIVLQL